MNKRRIFISVGIALLVTAWRLDRYYQKRVSNMTAAAATMVPPTDPIQTQTKTSEINSSVFAQSNSPQTDPKVAAFRAIMTAENAQAQDFYGKAVDQYDQPVAGATATGTLMQIQGIDVGTRKEIYTTQSDGNGYFEFTQLHGWQLGVVIKKSGYEMGQGTGFYQAPNAGGKTSSAERAIFHMWKLKGPEPMVHTRIEAGLKCDGTSRNFDVFTGKRDTGNTVVKLTRIPINIDRSKPFDWTLSLEISNGGLIEITDLYPNEAPASGYKGVTVSMSSDTKTWTPSFIKSYYIYDGKNYGRIIIHLTADYQPPPTHFEIESYINPSGSRNLEFARTQEIPAEH